MNKNIVVPTFFCVIAYCLHGAFRRTPNDLIKRHLKMKRQNAERQLNELKSRLLRDANGKLVLTFPTDLDQAIVSCLLGHITARPAFTDQQLIDQFSDCLLANGLLQKSELRAFRSLKELVGLFAVTNMHLCMIDLGNGSLAEMKAGATKSEGVVEVSASADAGDGVRFGATFFRTEIDVFEHTEPELHPESDQTPMWNFHIEISASGKLTRLS